MIEKLIYKELDSVVNNHGKTLKVGMQAVAYTKDGEYLCGGTITRIGKTILQMTMVEITYEVVTTDLTKSIACWVYMDMVTRA